MGISAALRINVFFLIREAVYSIEVCLRRSPEFGNGKAQYFSRACFVYFKWSKLIRINKDKGLFLTRFL